MKYTDALCEKDFTIIKQLNKFTDQETLLRSIDKLKSNSNAQTAERLANLYPIRLKELAKYSHCTEIAKDFSDCTIPIVYDSSQDIDRNKYYALYGEQFFNDTGRRDVFHGIVKASSRKLALTKYPMVGEKRINKDATKMIASNTLQGKKITSYHRIKELNEDFIDLKTVADNYFKETGVRLLEDISTLVMTADHRHLFSPLKHSIYENGFYVGITSDLNLSVLRSTKIDRKTMTTLLWYYIGFTPEQIEYRLSNWSF